MQPAAIAGDEREVTAVDSGRIVDEARAAEARTGAVMVVVGLIVHLGREEAAAHRPSPRAWLVARRHTVRIPVEDAEVSGLAAHQVTPEGFGADLDLVVTLGGDGSILRAVELLGPPRSRSSVSTTASWGT